MPKPDPALLEPERYPFSCAIPTRFGDLDTNLHINNVAMAGLLEDARVRFHRESGYHAAIEQMTSMAVSIAIEYLGQGYYPQPIEIHVAATDIGRTSYALCQLVTQETRIVAFARAVFVCVRDDRPVELPAIFTETVRPYLLRQPR